MNTTLKIDGIGVNALHYSSMPKDKVAAAMKADGLTDDKAWAESAWEKSKKYIADQKAKQKEAEEKQKQKSEVANKAAEESNVKTFQKPLGSAVDNTLPHAAELIQK